MPFKVFLDKRQCQSCSSRELSRIWSHTLLVNARQQTSQAKGLEGGMVEIICLKIRDVLNMAREKMPNSGAGVTDSLFVPCQQFGPGISLTG